MQAYQWHCGRFKLELSQPQIMGIVNATPDSFSDGGLYSKNIGSALKHAEQLLKDGADILDIGGESTRPGSDEVAVEEEWSRLEPVLAELITWNIPLSVDTRRTWVMEKVLENGYADIINDVAALTDEGAVSCLASYQDIGICLMHMQGAPKTMQQNPQYHDVVREVADFLAERVAECSRAGIRKDRIVLDPGFGFGKTLQHNIELMKHLNEFDTLIQLPVLVGVSRKRMIGELTGVENPLERVTGSVAAALAALARGAQVIRVHDVKETVEAVKVWRALGVSV